MFPEQGLLGLRHTEKEATDFNEMRKEMECAAYDSSLINRAFQHARCAGLSGEDKYTLLAYHALKALQTHYQLNMDYLVRTPMPGMVFKVGEGG